MNDHEFLPYKIGLLATLGWLGQHLAIKKQWPPPPELVGGFLLAPVLAYGLFELTAPIPGLSEEGRVGFCVLAGMGCVPVWKAVLSRILDKIKGESKNG